MTGSQSDAQLAAQCEDASRLIREGKDDAALAVFQSCFHKTKNKMIRAGILNGLGQICCGRGQMDEALSLFREAHDLYPDSPDTLANIALCHKWRGNLDQAERWAKRALKRHPWHNAAQFTQALIALLAGDYKTGFELYECRFRSRVGGLKKLETPIPEWDGSNGKNLYVYGEQGSGDIFLMLRYARLIRERGLRQTWVVHRPMTSLVQTMPEIDSVLNEGDPIPQFDCHIPAASLPRLFGTTLETIPSAPYITKPEPIDYGDGFHVGIVWRGSKSQGNDRFRSTCLDSWAPVLGVEGVTFHSLQVDGADEALFYPQIIPHKPPASWMGTAQRVAGMDLVISVDTSMVHLCGAMGVPVWCALHCRPYFVFPIIREDCPWYPSVRLFKQKKEFHWQPVFQQIAQQLKNENTQNRKL